MPARARINLPQLHAFFRSAQRIVPAKAMRLTVLARRQTMHTQDMRGQPAMPGAALMAFDGFRKRIILDGAQHRLAAANKGRFVLRAKGHAVQQNGVRHSAQKRDPRPLGRNRSRFLLFPLAEVRATQTLRFFRERAGFDEAGHYRTRKTSLASVISGIEFWHCVSIANAQGSDNAPAKMKFDAFIGKLRGPGDGMAEERNLRNAGFRIRAQHSAEAREEGGGDPQRQMLAHFCFAELLCELRQAAPQFFEELALHDDRTIPCVL